MAKNHIKKANRFRLYTKVAPKKATQYQYVVELDNKSRISLLTKKRSNGLQVGDGEEHYIFNNFAPEQIKRVYITKKSYISYPYKKIRILSKIYFKDVEESVVMMMAGMVPAVFRIYKLVGEK